MDQPLSKKTKGYCYNYKSISAAGEGLVTASVTPDKDAVSVSHEPFVGAKTHRIVEGHLSFGIADQYDYCLIFPAVKRYFTRVGEEIIESLEAMGFQLYMYHGLENSKVIVVLIYLPLERLREVAERDECSLMLDPKVAKKAMKEGDSSHGIKPCYIAHRPDVTPLKPYQYIYVPYRRRYEQLYAKHDATTGFQTSTQRPDESELQPSRHPFSPLVRLKTIAMMLYSYARDDSPLPGLNMRQLIADGVIGACYPLHNPHTVSVLDERLSRFPWEYLPLDELKEYFGEKIGVYFAFAEHLGTWLLFPAMLGLPLQLFVALQDSLSETSLAVYAYVVALWAVFMLEYWKRREKMLSLQWGTVHFEETEVERPDFKGELITSYIDGAQILHFPSHQRNFYVALSFAGVALLLVLALGVLVSIYIIRFTVERDIGVVNAQIMASVLNSAQIQILNYFYSHILRHLTDKENHRTDTQYEDSLIMKIFVFLFINSYASFYYLAFVAENFGDCPATGCMYSLAINLAVVFGSSLASSVFFQIAVPYASYQWQYYERKDVEHKITRPEQEYLLGVYDHLATTIEDYAELAVGFGYNALFVAALPIAALFYMLFSAFQIRGDGWKLLHVYRRALPRGCEDIGTWQNVFLMVSIASVVTNAGLAVFTMQQWDHLSTETRFWIFLGFQWTCFALQAFIMAAIPDVPEEMDIQLRRTAFIQRKLIDKVPDADA